MLECMRNHPSLQARYAMKSQGIILEISIAELILFHEHEFEWYTGYENLTFHTL